MTFGDRSTTAQKQPKPSVRSMNGQRRSIASLNASFLAEVVWKLYRVHPQMSPEMTVSGLSEICLVLSDLPLPDPNFLHLPV